MEHIMVDLIIDFLDNNLTGKQIVKIEEHLNSCSECNEKVKKIASLQNLLKTASKFQFPENSAAEFPQHLKSWGYDRYKEVLEARQNQQPNILKSIKAILAKRIEIPSGELQPVFGIRKDGQEIIFPYRQQYTTDKIKIDLTISHSEIEDKRNLEGNIISLHDKKPVIGYSISLDKNLEHISTAQTNKRGYFSMDNIKSGNYTLKIQLDEEEIFVEPLHIK